MTKSDGLSKTTKIQVQAIAEKLKRTENEVIELAISELYQAVLGDELTRLIPRENNYYDVQIGSNTFATVNSAALQYVPEDMKERMLTCGEDAGFSMILLSAAKAGHELIYYENNEN